MLTASLFSDPHMTLCCALVSAPTLKVHRKSVHVLLLTSSVKNNSALCSFQRRPQREILELLRGLHRAEDHRTESDPAAAPSRAATGREPGSVCRKWIQAQDVSHLSRSAAGEQAARGSPQVCQSVTFQDGADVLAGFIALLART